MKTEFPELLNRVKGGVFYAAIMAAGVAAGFFYPVVTVIFFAVLAAGMCLELLKALRRRFPDLTVGLAVPGLIAFAAPLLARRADTVALLALLLVWCAAFFAGVLHLIRFGPERLPAAVASGAGTMYVYGSLALLGPLLLYLPKGNIWLVFALLSPAVCDVFAYLGGVRFGRRKIVPALSPKKTWGGAVAGTAGAIACSLLFFLVWLRPAGYSFWGVLLLAAVAGLIVSLLAQAGDWTASAVKRYTGIKDYSRLILGHGGLFDRLDSFVAVLPFAFMLAVMLGGKR